ncbi:hypothetical protein ADIS_4204 [Lunatimonas lonarensis]|uniref:Uncharacterized protein n=1 Tax=Lunatimonas lonarensis TaxID=1232681 RepID=R7ZMK8_9BACT|nr:hypothetical protein ADIS_4204 [Lunatimonas lonarensis]
MGMGEYNSRTSAACRPAGQGNTRGTEERQRLPVRGGPDPGVFPGKLHQPGVHAPLYAPGKRPRGKLPQHLEPGTQASGLLVHRRVGGQTGHLLRQLQQQACTRLHRIPVADEVLGALGSGKNR